MSQPRYPSRAGGVLPEVEALRKSVAALQEQIEIMRRQRGYTMDSMVSVRDLIKLELITVQDIEKLNDPDP